jgi:hypothetical protein
VAVATGGILSINAHNLERYTIKIVGVVDGGGELVGGEGTVGAIALLTLLVVGGSQ